MLFSETLTSDLQTSLLLAAVAINLIVQHIQDILNGGVTKRLNGWLDGYGAAKKQPSAESSSRPH